MFIVSDEKEALTPEGCNVYSQRRKEALTPEGCNVYS